MEEKMEVIKLSEAVKLNEQGSIYMEAENYEEAIKCFEKAREIDPKAIDAYVNLGIAYASQDNFDKAYEVFQEWFLEK
ncbi:tetratricopeptide repeat protein [Clostridium sp. SHJSY1]|uniref:tetratricopeptide repeat protein n=1 Tax=Clostridium sp. SHJSY1 TaxID=2942483 RepID=UPI0028759B23|nr:tetratricopeptide repeat protein [Clostridium sp. SHJSY1]MDS0524364.1 tetratricopeptide repeat protein [Clostridium sp. SHJSY1]